jgi:RimJ/RimL family protein N-acetyltransferase
MRYYSAPFDRSGVEECTARNCRRYANDGHGLWAMVLKTNGELIGDCGLTVQDVDGATEVEIGYHMRRDHWGKGLATEASRACRDYGFGNLPVERLVSMIRPENLPSRRVAEKNGMSLSRQMIWRNLPHFIYSVRRESAAGK